MNWDFGRGPEYESSLDPQARELVGYCMDMASEEVGFGRSEGTCNGSPSPRLFNKMTNVNATHLIGDI